MDKCSQRLPMGICIIIILLVTVKKVKASSYSCDETKKTVEIVDDCPYSAEKWNEAAAKKNCSANANQCDEPENFVYHCVINAYANQTLEVCAYAQNIVSGYCTEYNVRGNLIQSSLRTSCKTFNVKPCPIFYRSNEAYKYPGCYELTKASTTPAEVTESTKNQVTHTPTYKETTAVAGNVLSDVPSTGSDSPENDDVTESPSRLSIPVIIILSTLIIITICVLVTLTFTRTKIYTACLGKLKSNDGIDDEGATNCGIDEEGAVNCSSVLFPSRDKVDDEKDIEDYLNLGDIPLVNVQMETKEEKKVLAPSGQLLEAGDRTSTLLKVEEEEIPDISINEKQKEEQECQMLLGTINDVLARIAILQHEVSREIVPTIDDHYNDPSFLSNETNEKIREEYKLLKSIEDYLKKEHTVTRE